MNLRISSLFSGSLGILSFAALTGQKLSAGDAPASFDNLNTLVGKSKAGREWLVEQTGNSRLSIIKKYWKFIEPGPGVKITADTGTDTGNDPLPQLYNLISDIGEKTNLAQQNPTIVKELSDLLQTIKDGRKSRL